MDSSLNILRKDVQCSLCRDTLIEPKILSCFHTFCKLCIKRHAELIDEVNVFRCPECKSQISLPQLNSVEELKPSLLHSRMIKVLDFVEREKVCSVSESHSPASWYCFDCNRALCDECKRSHSVFVKNHKVVSNVDTREEHIKMMLSRETNCEHHVDKTVDLFCKDCEKVLCIECWKQDHDEHTTVTLAKHTSVHKTKMSLQLEDLKKREQVLIKKFKTMKEFNEKFKRSCEKAKEEVKEKLRNLIQLLKENAKNLVKEIDENIEAVEKEKVKGQSVLDQVRGAIDYTNKLIDKGIGSEVIYMKDMEEVGKDADIYEQIEENQDFEMTFLLNEDLMREVQSGLGTLKRISKTGYTKYSVKVDGEPEALHKMNEIVLTNDKKNTPSYNAAGQQVNQVFPQAGGFYMPQMQQIPQMAQVRPRWAWNMQQPQQQMRPAGVPNMPTGGQVPRARGVRQVQPRGIGLQAGVPQGLQVGVPRMPNVPMAQQPPRVPTGSSQIRPNYKFAQAVRNEPPNVPGDGQQGIQVPVNIPS